MDREPYRILEDAIDRPGEHIDEESQDFADTFWDPDTLRSILLHGVDKEVEKIKIRLSQKDCEECGESKLQKESIDFFEGRFLCEACYMDLQ